MTRRMTIQISFFMTVASLQWELESAAAARAARTAARRSAAAGAGAARAARRAAAGRAAARAGDPRADRARAGRLHGLEVDQRLAVVRNRAQLVVLRRRIIALRLDDVVVGRHADV